MSYIDENLLNGEQVVYRATLHKIIYIWPAFLVLLGLLAIAGSGQTALFFFVIAGIVAAICYAEFKASEFGITNKRVLVKVGIFSRRSVEILLTKVEGIGVNQGILGKSLDYGTIVITGTGGTKEPFNRISNPLEFRRKVQEQIAEVQVAK
jgi:uncharacterized membrane protein YdbT with pleckstrin-like domain